MDGYEEGRWIPAALLAVVFCALLGGAGPAGAGSGVPEGFVRLEAIDPTIHQDIRYAGNRNFVGRPLAGYEATACLLMRATAEALATAQAQLAARGLSLAVLDCYRPQRASDDLMRWAAAEPDARSPWHPTLRRGRLFERGYIARRSGHSRGYAVDVTIVRATWREEPGGPATVDCTAARPQGAATGELDFGTTFDCFDPSSATKSPAVSDAARANRALLVSVMAAAGFRNYAREWWHFSLITAPADAAYHDFVGGGWARRAGYSAP